MSARNEQSKFFIRWFTATLQLMLFWFLATAPVLFRLSFSTPPLPQTVSALIGHRSLHDCLTCPQHNQIFGLLDISWHLRGISELSDCDFANSSHITIKCQINAFKNVAASNKGNNNSNGGNKNTFLCGAVEQNRRSRICGDLWRRLLFTLVYRMLNSPKHFSFLRRLFTSN